MIDAFKVAAKQQGAFRTTVNVFLFPVRAVGWLLVTIGEFLMGAGW